MPRLISAFRQRLSPKVMVRADFLGHGTPGHSCLPIEPPPPDEETGEPGRMILRRC